MPEPTEPAGTPRPRHDGADRRRQRLGAHGEQLALKHFERLGFTLLERNYRTRWGELDLIVHDGSTLVFVEVKTALADARVAPFDRLHAAKRSQVRKIARAWLHERSERPRAREIRFDAVGVTLDRSDRLLALEHLEGAF